MDTSGVTFDTTAALAVGSLILIGAGSIWGARKAIGMANR